LHTAASQKETAMTDTDKLREIIRNRIAYHCDERKNDYRLGKACVEPLIDDIVYAISAWNRRAQPENEPLTLEYGFDITNADGSPIDYDALGQKYKDQLCYCDIDGFYIGEDGRLVLMDDCGSAVWVDRGDYHVEIRKPERSEG
jgi:hypothetical protein